MHDWWNHCDKCQRSFTASIWGARDLVLGMRVVQSSGTVVKSGGKVVKNVAGYDLNKLYLGSFGTLGVITEVSLKLQPLPEIERNILLTFADIGRR